MTTLVVEDDFYYGTRLCEMLSDRGECTILSRSVQDALRVPSSDYGAAIIDVMLPNDPESSGITVEESRGGFLAGVGLARRFRTKRPDMKMVLITSDALNLDAEQWAASQGVPFLWKYETPRVMLDALQRVGILKGRRAPRAFIVHGHDDVALLELKNFLQNALHWQEPVVLREQPNCGRTLIEKFEDFASDIDCVFVLLTPDDVIGPGVVAERRRSRQNVIFEFGFFLAQFGRLSGRIIALHKGPNDLPSDIEGVVWIGIEGGVEAVGEQIRREVAGLAENVNEIR